MLVNPKLPVPVRVMPRLPELPGEMVLEAIVPENSTNPLPDDNEGTVLMMREEEVSPTREPLLPNERFLPLRSILPETKVIEPKKLTLVLSTTLAVLFTITFWISDVVLLLVMLETAVPVKPKVVDWVITLPYWPMFRFPFMFMVEA